MPEKDLVCPDTYVKRSMPKIPGCPAAAGRSLQYASEHAFLAILTHNSLRGLFEQEAQSSRSNVMMK